MAKSKSGKSAKTKKKAKPKAVSPFAQLKSSPHAGLGDLRLIRQHMDAHRAGEPGALEVLTRLGRDASFTAYAYAKELGDAELLDIARRLVAVPPEVHTNLFALREASVDAVVARHEGAPDLDALEPFTVMGSFGLFDPANVKTAIAKGGRPRTENAKVLDGTVAILGMSVPDLVTVRFEMGPPPEGTATFRRRLKVSTGVVAVGAPEASDGPRLGAVRIDPEQTGLDLALAAGKIRIGRIRPGIYALDAAHLTSSTLTVWVHPDPSPSGPLPPSADAPTSIPIAG